MESAIILSRYLERKVQFDVYLPSAGLSEEANLLLFNDGQDLRTMDFSSLFDHLQATRTLQPLIVAAIHAGKHRKQEYGVAGIPDHEGRGTRAGLYTEFILQEFLPHLSKTYSIAQNTPKAFAGFSLGGLSALDIVWNHPDVFSRAGVFSGALWWRSRELGANYDDRSDRIIHNQIKNNSSRPELKFFFQCGTEDEKYDRNANGIIDSIDDTLDLILELKGNGYQYPGDIAYLETPEGKHNPLTWKAVMPEFLNWGWAAH